MSERDQKDIRKRYSLRMKKSEDSMDDDNPEDSNLIDEK
jgi:hypothetical protein